MQDNINVLQNKEKQIKKIIKIFKKKGVNINEILLNASDSSQSEGSEELYDESYKLSRLKAPLIEEDLQIKEEYADESSKFINIYILLNFLILKLLMILKNLVLIFMAKKII